MKLTPTARIDTVMAAASSSELGAALAALIMQYSAFLECTNASEPALLTLVGDNDQWREMSKSAPALAESIFHAVNGIGAGGMFHRMLVV